MVGSDQKRVRVEDVLSDSQVCHIVKRCVGETTSWHLVDCELRPAAEGMAGFLGDHFRLAFTVKLEERVVKIPLFVKSIPLSNAPKSKFIDEHNFFRRETVVFKLMEEMETGSSHPWGAKAFLYNESVLVMRDLAPQGYRTRDQLTTFNREHVQVALASVARFHAASAVHETRKTLSLHRPYTLLEEFGDVIVETNFKNTPWMRAGAKLAANIIENLSERYKNAVPDLESQIWKQFMKACDELAESKESVNVLLHKDLWANNIMFKYEDGVPVNAILVDFQCVRYAPPAFDVILFFYVTTSRSFREQYEAEFLQHYFQVFVDSLDVDTKLRLKGLGYDYEEFLKWIEYGRKFGIVLAIMILPYALMDQGTAREMFDNPATYQKVTNEDRSEPVLGHVLQCAEYGRRLVEVNEEFVERYLGVLG